MFDFNVNISFALDKSQLNFMLHDPNGDVGKFMRRRARMLIQFAQSQAGKETGELSRSIKILLHNRTAIGQKMWIGSKSDHAYYVHEGTRPHEIHARDNGIMRFSGAGRVVYTHSVNHPGTRPNRYLSNNLWVFRI